MNAHTPFDVYAPSRSLTSRISRRLVKYVEQRPLTLKAATPIVSFSFDDCPRSVFETALPQLEGKGWRSTIYAAMGLCGTTNHLGLHMSVEEMKQAHDKGHDIGDHTFSHIDARAVTTSELMQNIQKNQDMFAANNIPPARTFAYPYGEVTRGAKQALSERFDLLRGIHSPQQTQSLDLNQAASQRLYSGQDFENCRAAIRNLQASPGWLILFTHDVRDTPSPFGCTPDEFQTIVNDVENIGAKVLTVADALDTLKGGA